MTFNDTYTRPNTANSSIHLNKSLGLKSIVRSVLKRLPTPLQTKIREIQAKNFIDTHGTDIAVILPVEELKNKQREALLYLQKKGTVGDYLEFGVFSGTSISCMFQVLQELNLNQVRLFGFDSFEGMPAIAAQEDEGTWEPGQFEFGIEVTREILKRRGVDLQRTLLTKGWFCDTLKPEFRDRHNIQKASIIMVDCDIYSSTVDVLKFCEPLIQDEAILFFDDWNSNFLADKNLGEKKAFDEFLHAHPEFSVEDFGTYADHAACFIVKRHRATA